jgi:hypothetical protein
LLLLFFVICLVFFFLFSMYPSLNSLSAFALVCADFWVAYSRHYFQEFRLAKQGIGEFRVILQTDVRKLLH